MNKLPIVVDLDGTLLQTDMLHESALQFCSNGFCQIFHIPMLILKGKVFLKQQLALSTSFDPARLPYNETLLDWLKVQRAQGRQIVLCTASVKLFADSIAKHLGLFDEVIASDGTVNLAGAQKAAALEKRFGKYGFDYAGNSKDDLLVWASARKAIVVNGSAWLIKNAQKIAEVERVFPLAHASLSDWFRALRIHQWLKNFLLFVPLLAAHDWFNPLAWTSLLLGWWAFSLCASSVYIVNDLLDLESDRQHPRKCKRPFACGLLPIWKGVVFAPVLLAFSMGLAAFVGTSFLFSLLIYGVLTCFYSWHLKRLLLLDCMVLAMLYTLRIVAGAAALDHELSFWLLTFSVFLFLSLAFVKRYAELDMQRQKGLTEVPGRGYQTSDAPLVQAMGIAAGYLSVLVLALYINSEAMFRLYASPKLLWLTVPMMLFWISWMWVQAHRGKMHDDPLVFAVMDRTSLVTGALFVAAVLAGAIGVSW